jgi:hypothetical protein
MWAFHDNGHNSHFAYSDVPEKCLPAILDRIAFQTAADYFPLMCAEYAETEVSVEERQSIMTALNAITPNGACVVYAEFDGIMHEYMYKRGKVTPFEVALKYMPARMPWHTEADMRYPIDLQSRFQAMCDQRDPATEMVWLFVASTGYVHPCIVKL